MISIVSVLIITAIAIICELPAIIRKRWIREAWIYSISLVFGLALTLAAVLLIPLSSPLNAVRTVYKPISDWLLR